MSLEPIGFLTLLIAILILRRGPEFGIAVLMTSFLLTASAAIKAPALGGASIGLVQVLLPFYAVSVLRLAGGTTAVFREVTSRGPGFWLACFAIFGAISAIFLPRLFAGEVSVFSISREQGEAHSAILYSPLQSSAANITQPVYLMADLVCFSAVAAHIRLQGLRPVVDAILIAATAHFVLGVVDALDYHLTGSALLEMIRNANYAILVEGDIGGLRRTIGGFTEASAYGGVALPFMAFAAELYLHGVRPRVTGPVALLSLFAVLASLSSSALVGLAIYTALTVARGVLQFFLNTSTQRMFVLLATIAAGLLLVVLIAAVRMDVHLWLEEIADQLFLDKLDSESGVERSLWNEYGIAAFFDTYMLGAGVGSIRASSFLVAILANTGIVGFCLMTAFLASLWKRAFMPGDTDEAARTGKAAGLACLAAIFPAMLAGSSVVLGVQFATFAAIATAASAATHWRTTPSLRGASRASPRLLVEGGNARR